MTLSTVHHNDSKVLESAQTPNDVDAFKKGLKLIHQFSGKSKDFKVADVWCLFICTIEIDDLS